MTENENKKEIKQLQKQLTDIQKQTAVSDAKQTEQLKNIEKEIVDMKTLVLSAYITKAEVNALIDRRVGSLELKMEKAEVSNAQSRKITFGMVTLIVTGVLGAIITLVVK